MSPNKVELEVLKVTYYRRKPYTMHYRVRRNADAPSHTRISYEWTSGAVRLNMTKIFSATFQKWYKLRFDEAEHTYVFDVNKEDKRFEVIEEIILAVEEINTNYFLFGRKP